MNIGLFWSNIRNIFWSIYTQNKWGVSVHLTGIGGDHVIGKMVHNVPFAFGDQTLLQTVCVAPIKELCLLGLDFLKATDCVLALASDILEIAGNVFTIKVAASSEFSSLETKCSQKNSNTTKHCAQQAHDIYLILVSY